MRNLLAGFAAAMLVAGCKPTDVPRVSPDGKRAALILPAAGEGEPAAIGVVPTEGGSLRRFILPEGLGAMGLVWAGDKLLVDATAPAAKEEQKEEHKEEQKEDPGLSDDPQPHYWLLDPADGTFSQTKVPEHITLEAFTGTWRGKPALYAPPMAGKTLVFSLPDLQEIGSLPFEARGAGDGWYVREVQGTVTRELVPGGKEADWIRESLPEDGRTRESEEMVALEVYNPGGKKVATLPRDEIGKACYRQPRSPLCARISPDGKRLLLGFGTGTIFRRHTHEYTFGVFDLAGAKLLWDGSSDSLRGLPAFTGDAVFILEAKERQIYTGERTPAAMLEPPRQTSAPAPGVVLARHTKKGREVVLDVPLKEGERATRYSYAAALKAFVLQTEGPKPRLLVVPVGAKTAAQDVREIRMSEEADK